VKISLDSEAVLHFRETASGAVLDDGRIEASSRSREPSPAGVTAPLREWAGRE
jgi:hypothetical protein